MSFVLLPNDKNLYRHEKKGIIIVIMIIIIIGVCIINTRQYP